MQEKPTMNVNLRIAVCLATSVLIGCVANVPSETASGALDTIESKDTTPHLDAEAGADADIALSGVSDAADVPLEVEGGDSEGPDGDSGDITDTAHEDAAALPDSTTDDGGTASVDADATPDIGEQAPDVKKLDCDTDEEKLIKWYLFQPPTQIAAPQVPGFQGGVEGCDGVALPPVSLEDPPGPCLQWGYVPPTELEDDCDDLLDPWAIDVFRYDCNLNLVMQTHVSAKDLTKEQLDWTFEWDDAGRISKELRYGWWLDNKVLESHSYTYDKAGRLVEKRKEDYWDEDHPVFRRVTYKYGIDGLLHTEERFAGPPASESLWTTIEFTYDDQDRLVWEKQTGSPLQVVLHEYETWESGTLERVSTDWNCGLASDLDCLDGEYDSVDKYYYDEAGHLVKRTSIYESIPLEPYDYSDSAIYHYDMDGKLVWDALWGPAESGPPYGGYSYFYDQFGRQASVFSWSDPVEWTYPPLAAGVAKAFWLNDYSCWAAEPGE